jgi:hypothetical protein
METAKRSKSEQARINGAKSKGPKSADGRRRSGARHFKHGLYAVNATVLDIESRDAFKILRDAAFAQWRPRNPFEAQYVEEIADCSWRIARLRLCATHESNVSIVRLREAAEYPVNYLDAIAKAEIDASSPQGAQTIIQRRINALIRNRNMLTTELKSLQNVISMGRTQETLQTQELPAGFFHSETHGNQPETQPNQA